MADTDEMAKEAKDALERVQNFDADSLVQERRLGEYSFGEAPDEARRLISLFKQLPTAIIDYLPEKELGTIKTQSNQVYELFDQILKFDLSPGDIDNRKRQAIQQVIDAHQKTFTALFPLISYSMARTVDFNNLEAEGRAAVRQIRDQTEALMAELETQKSEAKGILEDVRKAAAEQGVSQQASYFKEEADKYQTDAQNWRWWTVAVAGLLGIYGVGSLFLHRIPFLSPDNIYETVQFTASKVLIFFVIAYMLVLCARNFLANRHNEIVNRHRQNSLMTYKALVDAGGTPEAKDVILNHAASSVYKLHDTGFAKGSDSRGASSSSIVEMLPRNSWSMNPSGNQ